MKKETLELAFVALKAQDKMFRENEQVLTKAIERTSNLDELLRLKKLRLENCNLRLDNSNAMLEVCNELLIMNR